MKFPWFSPMIGKYGKTGVGIDHCVARVYMACKLAHLPLPPIVVMTGLP